MALSTRLLALRRSPILLKLPPYLSALCVVVGVAWLLILPLDEYSRQTYVSENAILPGQVHTYYGGSEHNVFRAYRQEAWQLSERSDHDRLDGLEHELRAMGLKAGRQEYSYRVAGEEISGTNIYGILQGPRADATEAIVLIAAWRNFEGQINYSGLALALSLTRYFKRWSIWSKDIILLIPADSVYGPQAWASAYHTTPPPPTPHRNISALPIKSGALQGAVALDYPAGPWGQRFDQLDVFYDGLNGALPNLDLLNTAVSVASSQMGISCVLHNVVNHRDNYADRLLTLTKGLLTQSVGHATGPHSAFMPYHVDAITLKTVGDGWHDEMSFGRTTESLFRSLNNLLEHLHQSFFFYILLNTNRFVSVGNYLPAAMIVAGSFTIAALALWVSSGKVASPQTPFSQKMEVVKDGKDVALVPKQELVTAERKIFLPAVLVLAVHLAGLMPLYLLNHVEHSSLPSTLASITALTLVLPIALSRRLARLPIQQVQILQCFSLLLLGATLSMLATINFSLALLIGLLCSPFSFVRPLRSLLTLKDRSIDPISLAIAVPAVVVFALIAPPVLVYIVDFFYLKMGIEVMLVEMARGWGAQGVWTGMVVWGLWWPGWVLSGSVMGKGLWS